MEAVIPRPDVAPMLQAGFVAVSSDCDEAEDEVIALAQQVEDAMMLPFISYAQNSVTFEKPIDSVSVSGHKVRACVCAS